MKIKLVVLTLALLAAGASITVADPLGTAFTYQGRLNDGPNPANGGYDLQFTLYDALTLDTTQGGPLTTNAVAVDNGLFAVTLDFGTSAFTGAARWLEIGVRTNGVGPFTTLTPRQAVLPTPSAIYAGNAGVAVTALSASSVPASALAAGSITSDKLAAGALAAPYRFRARHSPWFPTQATPPRAPRRRPSNCQRRPMWVISCKSPPRAPAAGTRRTTTPISGRRGRLRVLGRRWRRQPTAPSWWRRPRWASSTLRRIPGPRGRRATAPASGPPWRRRPTGPSWWPPPRGAITSIP